MSKLEQSRCFSGVKRSQLQNIILKNYFGPSFTSSASSNRYISNQLLVHLWSSSKFRVGWILLKCSS